MDFDQEKADRLDRLGRSATTHNTSYQGERYTVFVKVMRIFLPLCALGILAVLMAWPDDRRTYDPREEAEREENEEVTSSKTIEEEQVENELISADFSSKTRSGVPYTLTAARAIQKKEQPDLIYLETLDGVLKSESAPVTLKADEGTYHQENQFLTLNQNVTISQSGRGTMYMQSLEADLQKGEAMSPLPVRGEGVDGTIEAQSMTLENQGDTIIFHGPAHLVMQEGFSSWGK